MWGSLLKKRELRYSRFCTYLEFRIGSQDTYSYRLVMRNQEYKTFSADFDFSATLGGKTGLVTTRIHMGLGPQNPIKKLVHSEDFLGQPLSRKSVLKISGLTPRYLVSLFPNSLPLRKVMSFVIAPLGIVHKWRRHLWGRGFEKDVARWRGRSVAL